MRRWPRRAAAATRRGAIIGGSLGALGGLGVGVFISLFCEAETGHDCTAAIPLLTLLGAGAGAGIGALIGAAIPRRAAEPDTVRVAAEPAASAAETRRGRIGSATLAVGAVGALCGKLESEVRPEWERGVAVRFDFFAELGSWFAVGPQQNIAPFDMTALSVGLGGVW